MKHAEPDVSSIATAVQQLAVMLSAGVHPGSAWLYLAESSASPVVRAVASADVTAIPDAIAAACRQLPPAEARAWRGVAAAWSVATDSGAPMAPALRQFASSLRATAQAQRDIRVALASPIATARLVMLLPLVGMAFGAVLGFDTLGVLVGTPVGWTCLATGALLLHGGHRWNRRMVAAAQPQDLTPGLECELMAIAVSGGGSIDGAVERTASALRVFDIPPRGEALGALALSARAGVPAGELLRSDADEARRKASADAAARASALGVRLMLPLGLFVLPAFMVLGVAPILVAVISSTVSGF